MLRARRPGARSPPPASTRRDVVGIATDFTACTMVPTLADGTPLCEVDGLADRPHAYVKLWKHHAAQPQADRINRLAERARRGLAAALRRADLLGVGVRQGPAAVRGGPRGLRPDGALGRGRRLDRVAAVRHLRPQRLHRRLQGHPAGRRLPDRRTFLAALAPGFEGFVADKLDHPIGQLGDRAGSLTAEAAAWTGLPEGIAVAVGNVDAHVTAPAAQAVGAGPDGRDHGHLDLPRDERRRAARGARHVRGRRRRHRRRQLGLRGRPERRRRHLRLVHRATPSRRRTSSRGRRRGGSRCTSTSPGWPGRRRSASTAWSPSTGTPATGRCSSTTSSPGWCVGQTLATRPEDVYRALLEATAFGTRVIVETFRDAGVPVDEFIVAGGLAKNAPAHADLRRRHPAPAVGHRLRAGPGARLGDPRGRRGRRLPRRADRRQDAWARSRKGVFLPDEARAAALRRALRRVPRACTTTSAAASPRMRRLKAMRRDAVLTRQAREAAAARRRSA